ncbi:MAG TPA: AMP-binding protein, partial [Myxococcota bacterium]|nr:AMP-binding protein [Myxococcota bacterium]
MAHYPKGTPAEIQLASYKNIPAVLEDAFEKSRSKPAFSNMGVTMTFGDVDVMSRRMAAFLQNDLKLVPGDRLVIQMPNVLQYPVALFGALRAGLTVVNLNPLYTAQEMEHHIRDSGAKAIIILENFADKLEAIRPRLQVEHVILTEVGDLFPLFKRTLVNAVLRYVKKMVPRHNLEGTLRFKDVLARGARATFSPPALDHESLAFLQYTGGTTGVAKGAMLTHGNIVANMLQVAAWLGDHIPRGSGALVAALPLYHVFCLTVNCLALFSNGTENILITNPRDIPGFIKTLAKRRPQAMTAVSTLVSALLHHPTFKPEYVSNFLFVVCGAMPLSSAVAEAWHRVTKAPLIEGYGLTEASPLVSCNPLDGRSKLGTVGMPVPSTEVSIQ